MKNLTLLACLALFFASCQTDQTPKLEQRLATLSTEMGGAAVTDVTKAEEYIKTAESLAQQVQVKDPNRAGDLLLKAAGVAKTIGQFPKAIALYGQVISQMPSHPKVSTAQFMTGFIYANDIGDLGKAKAEYESFLKRYPNDELAESARMELTNLGKSPDDLIKQFEQQQKQTPQ